MTGITENREAEKKTSQYGKNNTPKLPVGTASEKVYRHYLEKICQAIRKTEDITPLLKEANADFNAIELVNEERKPIIGIVGEIYIRSNRFSNKRISCS